MNRPSDEQIRIMLDGLRKGDHLALFWGASDIPSSRCCVLYLRVSSKRQLDGEGLGDQWERSVAHAERQGWTVVGLYVDPAISGRKESRPAINLLKRDAQRKLFRYAVCYKVNRIGRNAKASYETADEIERSGVEVVSATEYFNRRTAAGNMTFGMLVVVAQFGSDQLSEVMRDRLSNKAKGGGWVGPVPFGYEKDDQGRLVPSPLAPVVREAFNRYKAGHSYLEIADWLNSSGYRTQTGQRFGRESVRTIIRNRAYLGFVSSGGVEHPGNHEPLIDLETWQRTAQLREQRSANHTTRHPDHQASDAWLSGLLRCQVCGEKLWARSGGNNGTTRYYRCSGHEKRLCEAKDLVPAVKLEEQLSEALAQLVLPADLLSQVVSEARKLVSQGQEATEAPTIDTDAIQGKLRRLGIVYADGLIDDKTYRKERDQLQALLAEAGSTSGPRLTFHEEKALRLLKNIGELLREATPEELREVARALFEKVWVRDEEVKAVTPRAEVYPLLAARSVVVWRVPDGARTHNFLIHSQALCH